MQPIQFLRGMKEQLAPNRSLFNVQLLKMQKDAAHFIFYNKSNPFILSSLNIYLVAWYVFPQLTNLSNIDILSCTVAHPTCMFIVLMIAEYCVTSTVLFSFVCLLSHVWPELAEYWNNIHLHMQILLIAFPPIPTKKTNGVLSKNLVLTIWIFLASLSNFMCWQLESMTVMQDLKYLCEIWVVLPWSMWDCVK